MGREIRRVPPNWEHPKKMFSRFVPGRGYCQVEDYQPMHDEDFATAMDAWYAGWKAWDPAENDGDQYWDEEGAPPDPAHYRPAWPEGIATWWQVYQTVSEGSPVTPPFATPEELIDYLATKGDFWDQDRGNGPWNRAAAERFVKKDGWAMSMMVVRGGPNAGVYTAATGFPSTPGEAKS
jgi:hypothetical protein